VFQTQHGASPPGRILHLSGAQGSGLEETKQSTGEEKIMSITKKPIAVLALVLAIAAAGATTASASPNGWWGQGGFSDAFQGD